VPHPRYPCVSLIHSRSAECRSRSGIQSISGLQRLETKSSGFRPSLPQVGSPEHRPLCLQTLLPTKSVCELATTPTGSSYRCVHPRLGDLSRVCLPSIHLDRPMPPTNSESTSVTPGVSSTSWASPVLVPSPIRPMHRLPCPHTNSGRPPDTESQTPPTQTLATSWVASVSRGYQVADISEKSREILLAAWRKNTASAYSCAWSKWCSWCSQWVNVDPLPPSLAHILDFFATQFQEGKEYRTINVYCSALSAVLPLIDGHKAGSHPLVCQMLKGCINYTHHNLVMQRPGRSRE